MAELGATAGTSSAAAPVTRGPALVISLDFELHWGIRDLQPADGPYAAHLHGARLALPRILDSFRRHGVAATWATVGFLFARDKDELLDHAPTLRPTYRDQRLDGYAEHIGTSERDDPLHFAPSLIDRISQTPRQEVASHTFSHYYCLEEGQTRAQFTADLAAARSIALARGITVRSLVLPRNQLNPDYLPVVRDSGFLAYRGNPRHWAFQERARPSFKQRAVRLVDSYTGLTGHHSRPWAAVEARDGLIDLPASLFLRPTPPYASALGSIAVQRVIRAMEHAAKEGGICHLWWHPHNFGTHIDRRIADLESILFAFRRLADTYGMTSQSMGDVTYAIAES